MEKQNFTRIPNGFLDEAVHFKLPIQCWQCLLFIIRQSWGWNRKSAELRIRGIANGTGLLPSNVIRALNRLENEKFIVVTPIDNKKAKRYRINFKYELSRQPDEILPVKIGNITSGDNKDYPCREQKITSTGNINSCKPMAEDVLHRPKENKENLKKFKESAKAEESKNDSSASLNRRPMTEAEMQGRVQLLQKQAEMIKGANRPSEQSIIARLKAERRNATDFPQVETCSVCDEMKKMTWNTGGYLLCYDCAQEDWIEKMHDSYKLDKSK